MAPASRLCTSAALQSGPSTSLAARMAPPSASSHLERMCRAMPRAARPCKEVSAASTSRCGLAQRESTSKTWKTGQPLRSTWRHCAAITSRASRALASPQKRVSRVRPNLGNRCIPQQSPARGIRKSSFEVKSPDKQKLHGPLGSGAYKEIGL